MSSHHSKRAAAGLCLALLGPMGADATRMLKSSRNLKASNADPLPDGLMNSHVEIQSLGSTSCGATALEGGWVISAAHCFFRDDRSARVRYGLSFVLQHSDGSEEIIRPAETPQIFIPSEYSPATQPLEDEFYGDIALIRLPELDRTDINFPRLPTSREEVETAPVYVAVGSGTTETGALAEDSEFVSLADKSFLGVTPAYAVDLPVEEDHFALRDKGGEFQTTCPGDSGGGIFIPSRRWDDETDDTEIDQSGALLNNARDVLVGLTSWGPGSCGGPDSWGAYTDVLYWAEWIQSVQEMAHA